MIQSLSNWVVSSRVVQWVNCGKQLIVCQCSRVRFICGSWGCAIRLWTTEQCFNERVLTCSASASRIFRIIEMFALNRFRNCPRAQNSINLNSFSRRSTTKSYLLLQPAIWTTANVSRDRSEKFCEWAHFTPPSHCFMSRESMSRNSKLKSLKQISIVNDIDLLSVEQSISLVVARPNWEIYDLFAFEEWLGTNVLQISRRSQLEVADL